MSRWLCLPKLFLDLNLLAKTLKNEIPPVCNFESGDHTHSWATPFFRFCAPIDFCNSVQEGCIDFFFLRMTAMATIMLRLCSNIYPKMLIFKENRRKLILTSRLDKNQFFAIISKNKHFKVYVAS